MLTVFIDFKSPASYLAFEPTLALIEETGVEVRWQPFSSRPFKIPAEQPGETVGERHRRVRAISQRDAHLHYAGVQGIEMSFPEKLVESLAESDAALAALAAMTAMTAMEGDLVPFIRAAFTAYWAGQSNLNDQTVVERLLPMGVNDIDWQNAHQKLQIIRLKAEEAGVFETPSYLIADQLFFGREHLPWIRSIISAKQAA